MNADDILKIIKAIPEYITYIYPGYLTIYCYYFLKGKTLKESNSIAIKALAISYIYIGVLDFSKIASIMIRNIILIIMACLTAYLAYRVSRSSIIITVFEFFKITTRYYENEMETLAEFDKGAWLIVYLKDDDVVYEGSLGIKELEEGKRQYISLDKYRKYYINKKGYPKEPYITDYSDNQKETVIIFYEDIKRVEKRDT